MKRILSFMGAALILVGLLQPVTNVPESPVAYAETHSQVINAQPNKLITPVEQVKESAPVADTVVAPVAVVEAPVAPSDSETVVWNYLIAQGFTRNQTAGIMGNLKQEHQFQTTDVPGGLGIAQWMGGRRDNLLAQADPYSLETQLNYLMSELNGGYAATKASILASDDLVNATLSFQNGFERCGVCRENTRINYAYEILGRH